MLPIEHKLEIAVQDDVQTGLFSLLNCQGVYNCGKVIYSIYAQITIQISRLKAAGHQLAAFVMLINSKLLITKR